MLHLARKDEAILLVSISVSHPGKYNKKKIMNVQAFRRGGDIDSGAPNNRGKRLAEPEA